MLLLPYVNMLINVFEYFKVLLEDEECIEVVDTVINKKRLKVLKFKYTLSR